jgi:DNA polymerase-3 subunit gamma/tau
LSIIHEALASGTDARQFCRQMVAYLRQLLLLQAAGDALDFEGTAEQKAEMEAQAQRASRPLLIEAVKKFNEAALTPASSWQPQLPLELAFVQLLPDEPIPVVVRPQPVALKVEQKVVQKPVEAEPAEEKPMAVQEKVVVREKPTAKPTPQTTLAIEQVTANWQTMLDDVAQSNKNLPPLLAMSKPLAIEGDTIVLGFDYPIFQEKFNNTPHAAETIGEVYSQLLNTSCRVRSVVTSEYNISISPDEFRNLADELGGVVRGD